MKKMFLLSRSRQPKKDKGLKNDLRTSKMVVECISEKISVINEIKAK
jgi:hypothetical protein